MSYTDSFHVCALVLYFFVTYPSALVKWAEGGGGGEMYAHVPQICTCSSQDYRGHCNTHNNVEHIDAIWLHFPLTNQITRLK